jgi:DNA-binding beta-propeller fold protein YncE
MLRLLCVVAGLFLSAALLPGEARPAKPPILPGIQADGFIRLPNQWSLKPAGKQLSLGDFPVNLALHPDGKYLAVLHAGFDTHEIMTIDLVKQKVVARVILDQTWYGLCFSPDGKKLFASGGEFEVVHSYCFDHGLLYRHQEIAVAKPRDKFIPGGLAVDTAGKTLYAAGTWGGAVCVVPLTLGEGRSTVTLGKESYPYACLLEPDRKARPGRLFVSLWSKAAVAVIDVKKKKVVATWPTERHPTEMVLAPNGKTLFVACANSTKVSVLDTATGQGRQTIACSLYPKAPCGNTPNSLSLTPDGQLLFVANADANNISVFNVTDPDNAKPLGFIPAGWYPTSVRYNAKDKRLYIANGKGTKSRANPQGPQPNVPGRLTVDQYIGRLFRGTLSIVNLPNEKSMPALSKQAYACSPLKADLGVTGKVPRDNPIPQKVGDPSPIKHCIYIIKENRTYDQVFGDMKQGNGDPNLCLFPDKITPNHHKLAREFVLLDNFYCEGEVSADGHQWSMGAYCTDFVEKVWPLTYRGSPKKKLDIYPSEGNMDSVVRPAGGYIWDRCAEAKVSYRSYGEWISTPKSLKQPGKALVKTLEGHFDPWFRGWDMKYPDQKRADRFIEELKRFEKAGDMPRMIILRLPNDHTEGTKVGVPTPTAFVADNDLALGRIVEAVSNSKFWKDTAFFVIEDDAQNGPDHVDAHRTVALVISPYTKRRQVDSTLYSTSSMLRTMELILGLKPMSQFDAAARPMYHSFQAKPDLTPYKHVVPQTDLKAKNKRTAWGAETSAKLDFSKEDAADDLVLNEIIWKSVRGAKSPMPPPVRAAFVFPHLKEEK